MTATAADVEVVIQAALNDHKYEDDLRTTHRIALERLRLQALRAEPHPNLHVWKREERRLWLLVQMLNNCISSQRWEIVDIDEEMIDELERRAQASMKLTRDAMK